MDKTGVKQLTFFVEVKNSNDKYREDLIRWYKFMFAVCHKHDS